MTIVTARYGGTYEVGRGLAFPSHPDQLPADWDAGDVMCARFWGDRARQQEIGGGHSPELAYADLLSKQARRRSASGREPAWHVVLDALQGRHGTDAGPPTTDVRRAERVSDERRERGRRGSS
ncbi:MAG TPA: hypothetical protein P5181_02255 [Dermatophilaceae bacterium]|nr:hypothetical protein [Dermatophilaceae bacterium]